MSLSIARQPLTTFLPSGTVILDLPPRDTLILPEDGAPIGMTIPFPPGVHGTTTRTPPVTSRCRIQWRVRNGATPATTWGFAVRVSAIRDVPIAATTVFGLAKRSVATLDPTVTA